MRAKENGLFHSTLNTQPSTVLHLLPAFTPERFRGLALGSRIQLQQRNCSRFARDFSRRSTFSSSQRTGSSISRLRSTTQAQISRRLFFFCHVERQRDVASV